MRTWLMGRRRSPALGISLVALFIALGGVGYAATNGGLLLGKTSQASKGTTLRSKGGPTLTLTNTGGKPAASFKVQSHKAPFTVNSRTKVAGLNADLIDGLDSSAFQRLVTGNCAPGSAIQVINSDGSVVCVNTLSADWSLNGNQGTNPGTDFLGTTDAEPLIIKTNNNEALRIDTSGNLGVGTSNPSARIDALAATSGVAINGTSNSGTAINGVSGTSDGVIGTSTSARGVSGISTSSDGVLGTSNSGEGVLGTSQVANGVVGQSTSGNGTGGVSSSGDGVLGMSSTASGVGGLSTSGRGLSGLSVSGDGAVGSSTGGTTAADGVLGITNHPSGGGTAAAVDAINTGGGDIFIGQTSASVHVARIDSSGKGFFDGGTQNSGADYAESMKASVNPRTLSPGDVLEIDPGRGNEVRLSDRADSQLVVGVYSTKPSVLAVGNHGIDDSLAGNVPVAMLGIVPTKVSAENGPVKPGDLLTTARTPGYAMKAKSITVGGVTLYPTGAILGKALEPLNGQRGVIEVLVTLR